MKTTVIHHSADFDGIFCREIARKFLPEAELIGWDFGDPYVQMPEEGQVYILDLSPECLDASAIQTTFWNRIIWIDHHKTAIDKFVYPTWPKMAGYRIDGVAACRLTWQWFSEYEMHNPDAELHAMIPGSQLPNKQNFVDRKVSEPLAVRLAGEYDIWDKRDPKAEMFQFGLRSQELTAATWRELLSGTAESGSQTVLDLLTIGQLLQRYQQQNDASVVKYRSFDLDFEGLKFIALNTARCNSLTFAAACKPEHDGCVGFYWNGKEWKVSLYGVPGKPDVDLSKIAVKFGGGGHKQACGFQAKRLPWALNPHPPEAGATRLKWTHETPRAEGWYWYRVGPGGHVEIAHITDADGWLTNFDSGRSGWAAEIRGQWAGPIPRPEEP